MGNDVESVEAVGENKLAQRIGDVRTYHSIFRKTPGLSAIILNHLNLPVLDSVDILLVKLRFDLTA